MQDEVGLSFDLKLENLCTATFTQRVIEEARYGLIQASDWTTDEATLLDRLVDVTGLEPIVQKREEDIEACVFYLGGALVYLQLWKSQVLLRIAADAPQAAEVEATLKVLLPEATLNDRVRLGFWYWDKHRGLAKCIGRLLSVPRWDEIRTNYAATTRSSLDRIIVEGFQPASGQLTIWYGEPGCGKTYALRALMRELRDSFSLHYISDTESFFANGEYMLSVMLSEDTDAWKLFVLEDAGEFLLPDARQQMGQGLSRLLNASDGLIGQGLKTMFLITTNEPVGKLHPAVSRPGRCSEVIEFDPLSLSEANEWLSRRGGAERVNEATVLADLFALADDRHVRPTPQPVGFR